MCNICKNNYVIQHTRQRHMCSLNGNSIFWLYVRLERSFMGFVLETVVFWSYCYKSKTFVAMGVISQPIQGLNLCVRGHFQF